jgi:hypothetical protein
LSLRTVVIVADVVAVVVSADPQTLLLPLLLILLLYLSQISLLRAATKTVTKQQAA